MGEAETSPTKSLAKYYRRLHWSIDGRNRTQNTTLRLYKVMQAGGQQSTRLQKQTHRLVAISFSLWRAVFLADRTGTVVDRQANAIDFLKAMLEDNAITYAQDKRSKEWTFSYYIDAAEFNLQRLAYDWPEILAPLQIIPSRNTARNRWDKLQGAYELAVELAEREAQISN